MATFEVELRNTEVFTVEADTLVVTDGVVGFIKREPDGRLGDWVAAVPSDNLARVTPVGAMS